MKIILDAMGGDNAPAEIVKGAVLAAGQEGMEFVLLGREREILAAVEEEHMGALPANITILNTEDVVTMEDDPLRVVKDRKDSSMVRGLEMLRDGQGDAFISAGSTGALMTAATLIVRRIKGIRRAAIAIEFPTATNGTTLIVDCGANAECTAEYLTQFAHMGSCYMHAIRGVADPRVGLLNIGEEETKGTSLQKETYALLKEAREKEGLNFTGNLEARDALAGYVDVIVTDGYSGNILLKSTEGVAGYMTTLLKDVFMKNMRTKLSYLVLKDGLREFKKKLDYTEFGGSPILGLAAPVIKAHGSSNAKAICSAIRQAKLFVEGDVVAKITDSLGRESGT